jgi:5-amino-6-(5-phospho-D-ribitylamino)uracil phosphatase
MKYQLIAFDLDGTLMSEDHTVSVANQTWIRHAQAAGIKITIATGRQRNSIVENLISLLNITVPVVTLNGSEIWSADKKLIFRCQFTAEDVRILGKIIQECDATYLAFHPSRQVTENALHQSLAQDTWLKLVFFSDHPEVLTRVRHQLETHGQFELSSSHSNNLEVNPKGISKATGLAVVCEELQISSDEVVVMGDGWNDVQMLAWAGLGIAMGNATQEVKSIANRVTDTCHNDGVAKAIERLLAESD